MKAILDIGKGRLVSLHGDAIDLDGTELTLAYWEAMGAPQPRIARATGLGEADLATRRAALAGRLGFDPADLSGCVEFARGRSPLPRAPWHRRTLAHAIDAALRAREPDAPLVFASGAGALTVAEVRDLVARIRARFRLSGIAKGDTIAADAAPHLEIYLLSLAAFLHGVRLVRLNEQVSGGTLDEMLATVPARLVFTARSAMIGTRTAQIVALPDAEGGTEALDFAAWLAEGPEPVEADRAPAGIDPFDIATIAFTSGSSGTPKGVAVTHEMAWATADRTASYHDFGPGDVHYSATDLSSNTSQNVLIVLPLLCGGTAILPSREALTSPLGIALDCETYGVTCMMTVPSVLRTLLETEEQARRTATQGSRLRSLRFVICTTAPLGRPLAERFHAACDARLVEAFATRETGTILVALDTRTATIAEGGGVFAELPGRLLTGEGRVVVPGEIGELCVQGPRFDHYLHADGSVEPSEAIRGEAVPGHPGWYRTGDLGRYVEGGRVEIVGRSRDIVKSPDGRLVLPSRIEAVLDGSRHVAESCVFRMLDDEGIERIGAAVVRADEDAPPDLDVALREAVRRERGAVETPVGVLVLDALPRVSRNKPDKPGLATMLKRRLEGAAR